MKVLITGAKGFVGKNLAANLYCIKDGKNRTRDLTSPTAEVEAGTVVLPLAIINTDCRIQSGCIINCGSIVDHGCVIEEGVHISPGTVIKAENRIPRATKIEAGEVVPLRAYPL